jgi:hypothetical protein
MKHAVLWIGVLLLSVKAHAGPMINVGVVYDYLEADRSSFLKRVFNGGTSTAFVKVDVLEILYNADGTSQEVALPSLADARGNTTGRDGLMASPARLIVPAGGRQGTRLLYRGERDKERYFRVRFIPVVPQKEDDFAVTEQERDDYKNNLAAGVNVMAGYGTVFFRAPQTDAFRHAGRRDRQRVPVAQRRQQRGGAGRISRLRHRSGQRLRAHHQAPHSAWPALDVRKETRSPIQLSND